MKPCADCGRSGRFPGLARRLLVYTGPSSCAPRTKSRSGPWRSSSTPFPPARSSDSSPRIRLDLARLTPSAFDDTRSSWAFCLLQAYAQKGDAASVRTYAEEARKAVEEELRAASNDAQRHFFLGLALAYLGRKAEAIREGERGLTLLPVSTPAGALHPAPARSDLHPGRRAGEGARPARAPAEDPLLPLPRLAQDRPQLRPPPQEPAIREARRRPIIKWPPRPPTPRLRVLSGRNGLRWRRIVIRSGRAARVRRA